MFKNKFIQKSIVWAVIFSFVASDAARAQGIFSGRSSVATAPSAVLFSAAEWLQNLRLPAEVGKIQDLHLTNGPVLIHIQDSHANLDAQKKIAAILEEIEKHSPQPLLIAVEGASGPISTALLRSFPDEKIRRRVADILRRDAYLTGVEHYSVVARRDPLLYGVENPELYEANRKVFNEVHANAQEALEQIREKIKQLKGERKKVFSEKFLEFSENREQFEAGSLSFKAYAQYLSWVYPRETQNELPEIITLARRADQLGSQVHPASIQKEEEAFFKWQQKHWVKEDYTQLLQKKLELRLGRITPLEYFSFLLKMIADVGARHAVPLQFPHLSQYLELLQLQEKVNPIRVMETIHEMEQELEAALLRSPEEKALAHQIKLASVAAKMAKLEMSPEDLTFYRQHKNDFDLPVVKEAEHFYSLATQRDRVLAENTLKLARRKPNHQIVLVTGGFHTRGMTQILANLGRSYAVLSPLLSAAPDAELYLKRMRLELSPQERALLYGGNRIAPPSLHAIHMSPEQIEAAHALEVKAVSLATALKLWEIKTQRIGRAIGNVSQQGLKIILRELQKLASKWIIQYEQELAKLWKEEGGKVPQEELDRIRDLVTSISEDEMEINSGFISYTIESDGNRLLATLCFRDGVSIPTSDTDMVIPLSEGLVMTLSPAQTSGIVKGQKGIFRRGLDIFARNKSVRAAVLEEAQSKILDEYQGRFPWVFDREVKLEIKREGNLDRYAVYVKGQNQIQVDEDLLDHPELASLELHEEIFHWVQEQDETLINERFYIFDENKDEAFEEILTDYEKLRLAASLEPEEIANLLYSLRQEEGNDLFNFWRLVIHGVNYFLYQSDPKKLEAVKSAIEQKFSALPKQKKELLDLLQLDEKTYSVSRPDALSNFLNDLYSYATLKIPESDQTPYSEEITSILFAESRKGILHYMFLWYLRYLSDSGIYLEVLSSNEQLEQHRAAAIQFIQDVIAMTLAEEVGSLEELQLSDGFSRYSLSREEDRRAILDGFGADEKDAIIAMFPAVSEEEALAAAAPAADSDDDLAHSGEIEVGAEGGEPSAADRAAGEFAAATGELGPGALENSMDDSGERLRPPTPVRKSSDWLSGKRLEKILDELRKEVSKADLPFKEEKIAVIKALQVYRLIHPDEFDSKMRLLEILGKVVERRERILDYVEQRKKNGDPIRKEKIEGRRAWIASLKSFVEVHRQIVSAQAERAPAAAPIAAPLPAEVSVPAAEEKAEPFVVLIAELDPEVEEKTADILKALQKPEMTDKEKIAVIQNALGTSTDYYFLMKWLNHLGAALLKPNQKLLNADVQDYVKRVEEVMESPVHQFIREKTLEMSQVLQERWNQLQSWDPTKESITNTTIINICLNKVHDLLQMAQVHSYGLAIGPERAEALKIAPLALLKAIQALGVLKPELSPFEMEIGMKLYGEALEDYERALLSEGAAVLLVQEEEVVASEKESLQIKFEEPAAAAAPEAPAAQPPSAPSKNPFQLLDERMQLIGYRLSASTSKERIYACPDVGDQIFIKVPTESEPKPSFKAGEGETYHPVSSLDEIFPLLPSIYGMKGFLFFEPSRKTLREVSIGSKRMGHEIWILAYKDYHFPPDFSIQEIKSLTYDHERFQVSIRFLTQAGEKRLIILQDSEDEFTLISNTAIPEEPKGPFGADLSSEAGDLFGGVGEVSDQPMSWMEEAGGEGERPSLEPAVELAGAATDPRLGAASERARHREVKNKPNEDTHFETVLPNGIVLAAVFDEMGAFYTEGKASNAAKEEVLRVLSQNLRVTDTDDVVISSLGFAMEAARAKIERVLKKEGGTTATVAVMFPVDGEGFSRVFIANAGDSRAYLFSGGKLTQLTVDNLRPKEEETPFVMDEERLASTLPPLLEGNNTLNTLKNPELRHNEQSVKESLYRLVVTKLKVREGSFLCLTSDGIHRSVERVDIANVIFFHLVASDTTPLSEAAQTLVRIAREGKIDDDRTVVVIEVIPAAVPSVASAAESVAAATGAAPEEAQVGAADAATEAAPAAAPASAAVDGAAALPAVATAKAERGAEPLPPEEDQEAKWAEVSEEVENDLQAGTKESFKAAVTKFLSFFSSIPNPPKKGKDRFAKLRKDTASELLAVLSAARSLVMQAWNQIQKKVEIVEDLEQLKELQKEADGEEEWLRSLAREARVEEKILSELTYKQAKKQLDGSLGERKDRLDWLEKKKPLTKEEIAIPYGEAVVIWKYFTTIFRRYADKDWWKEERKSLDAICQKLEKKRKLEKEWNEKSLEEFGQILKNLLEELKKKLEAENAKLNDTAFPCIHPLVAEYFDLNAYVTAVLEKALKDRVNTEATPLEIDLLQLTSALDSLVLEMLLKPIYPQLQTVFKQEDPRLEQTSEEGALPGVNSLESLLAKMREADHGFFNGNAPAGIPEIPYSLWEEVANQAWDAIHRRWRPAYEEAAKNDAAPFDLRQLVRANKEKFVSSDGSSPIDDAQAEAYLQTLAEQLFSLLVYSVGRQFERYGVKNGMTGFPRKSFSFEPVLRGTLYFILIRNALPKMQLRFYEEALVGPIESSYPYYRTITDQEFESARLGPLMAAAARPSDEGRIQRIYKRLIPLMEEYEQVMRDKEITKKSTKTKVFWIVVERTLERLFVNIVNKIRPEMTSQEVRELNQELASLVQEYKDKAGENGCYRKLSPEEKDNAIQKLRQNIPDQELLEKMIRGIEQKGVAQEFPETRLDYFELKLTQVRQGPWVRAQKEDELKNILSFSKNLADVQEKAQKLLARWRVEIPEQMSEANTVLELKKSLEEPLLPRQDEMGGSFFEEAEQQGKVEEAQKRVSEFDLEIVDILETLSNLRLGRKHNASAAATVKIQLERMERWEEKAAIAEKAFQDEVWNIYPSKKFVEKFGKLYEGWQIEAADYEERLQKLEELLKEEEEKPNSELGFMEDDSVQALPPEKVRTLTEDQKSAERKEYFEQYRRKINGKKKEYKIKYVMDGLAENLILLARARVAGAKQVLPETLHKTTAMTVDPASGPIPTVRLADDIATAMKSSELKMDQKEGEADRKLLEEVLTQKMKDYTGSDKEKVQFELQLILDGEIFGNPEKKLFLLIEEFIRQEQEELVERPLSESKILESLAAALKERLDKARRNGFDSTPATARSVAKEQRKFLDYVEYRLSRKGKESQKIRELLVKLATGSVLSSEELALVQNETPEPARPLLAELGLNGDAFITVQSLEKDIQAVEQESAPLNERILLLKRWLPLLPKEARQKADEIVEHSGTLENYRHAKVLLTEIISKRELDQLRRETGEKGREFLVGYEGQDYNVAEKLLETVKDINNSRNKEIRPSFKENPELVEKMGFLREMKDKITTVREAASPRRPKGEEEPAPSAIPGEIRLIGARLTPAEMVQQLLALAQKAGDLSTISDENEEALFRIQYKLLYASPQEKEDFSYQLLRGKVDFVVKKILGIDGVTKSLLSYLRSLLQPLEESIQEIGWQKAHGIWDEFEHRLSQFEKGSEAKAYLEIVKQFEKRVEPEEAWKNRITDEHLAAFMREVIDFMEAAPDSASAQVRADALLSRVLENISSEAQPGDDLLRDKLTKLKTFLEEHPQQAIGLTIQIDWEAYQKQFGKKVSPHLRIKLEELRAAASHQMLFGGEEPVFVVDEEWVTRMGYEGVALLQEIVQKTNGKLHIVVREDSRKPALRGILTLAAQPVQLSEVEISQAKLEELPAAHVTIWTTASAQGAWQAQLRARAEKGPAPRLATFSGDLTVAKLRDFFKKDWRRQEIRGVKVSQKVSQKVTELEVTCGVSPSANGQPKGPSLPAATSPVEAAI